MNHLVKFLEKKDNLMELGKSAQQSFTPKKNMIYNLVSLEAFQIDPDQDIFKTQVRLLILHTEIVLFKPEDVIIKQYDNTQEMYFISRGSVHVK